MRVASLLASGTEIVCALGAGESLVGRSHECDNPPWVRSLPCLSEPAFDVSVSSREIDAEVTRRIRSGEPLYRIDTERIRELHPDVIITQAHCEVCAVTPGDINRSGCETPAATVLALTAGSLDGIFEGIRQVARAIGREEEGEHVVGCERRRLQAVKDRVAGRRRPRTVILEWTDPIFATGNWGPELAEIAGGEAVLGTPREHSRAIPAERVIQADPEVLIVAPCGFPLDRACQDREIITASLGQEWMSRRKVAFADGNLFFNRSGMTISRTAEIIAEILHGVVFGEPAEGVHWRR